MNNQPVERQSDETRLTGELDNMLTRICPNCDITKNMSEYYKDKYRANGYKSWCKKCYSKTAKKQYSKSKEYHRKSIDKLQFGGNREKTIQRDGEKCVKCGVTRKEHLEKYRVDIHVDHIDGLGFSHPKEEKNNSMDNLQTICIRCHGKKDGWINHNLSIGDTPHYILKRLDLGGYIGYGGISQAEKDIFNWHETEKQKSIRNIFGSYDSVTNPDYTFMISKKELDDILNKTKVGKI